MNPPHKVLMLEDNKTDAALVRRVVEKSELGVEIRHVETLADFRAALTQFEPTLILSDFNLSGFSGMDAFAEVRREGRKTPFILVTGTLSEETAVECIKAGIDDYILKDRLTRLPAAMQAALQSHAVAREKEAAEENLRQSEARFRFLVENSSDLVVGLDAGGGLAYVGPSLKPILGFEAGQLLGKPLMDSVHPEDRGKAGELLAAGGAEGRAWDLRLRNVAGDWRILESRRGPAGEAGGELRTIVYARDVTERRAAEQREIRREREEKEKWRNEAEDLFHRHREAYAKDYLFLPSKGMQEIYRQLETLSDQAELSLLITGETGTGKEHVARLAHLFSSRRAKPFVELHCAALPETLLESELFGYEAGAFTDARKQKKGLMETAQGGTIFLDEVGEMPLATQTKLLKVLEQKTLRRLGGTQELKLDVRVIAATNRDLRHEVAERRFREDLYYRLNIFPLHMPALSQRPEDVEALAVFLYAQACDSLGKPREALGPETLEMLRQYSWPGNVRELKNLLYRLALATRGPVQAGDLVQHLPKTAKPAGPKPAAPGRGGLEQAGLSREEGERIMVQSALDQAGGSRSQAARILGVTRQTLLNKIKKYNLG